MHLKKFFSRNAVFLILLIVQIFLSVSLINDADRNFYPFHRLFSILDAALALVIFNSDSYQPYKTAWIVLICVLPIFGSAAYLLTRFTSFIQRKSMSGCTDHLSEPDDDFSDMHEELPQYAGLAGYIRNCSGSGVFRGTVCEYFPIGELQFEAVLRELRSAEHFIFMEFYIISEGFMLRKILEILSEKARNGVDVRIMYDGIGTGLSGTENIFPSLEKKGIKCRAFNRFTPFLSSAQNNRDHRKIIVIDGKTAFNGGTNIADEYINRTERFGHWKDCAVMLKGRAVRNYTEMFTRLWDTVSKADADNVICQTETSDRNDGFVQPFAFSPLDKEPVGKQVYLEMIYSAKKYVHITTPYLLPDEELVNALRAAALKNIEVIIIAPKTADKKSVQYAARNNYRKLINAGVRIFEYSPGFIHSKLLIADGKTAVVGTINLDCRSMYLQFESAAVMYGCCCIRDMESDFAHTLSLSEAVGEEHLKIRSFSDKAAGYILNLFSPLL